MWPVYKHTLVFQIRAVARICSIMPSSKEIQVILFQKIHNTLFHLKRVKGMVIHSGLASAMRVLKPSLPVIPLHFSCRRPYARCTPEKPLVWLVPECGQYQRGKVSSFRDSRHCGCGIEMHVQVQFIQLHHADSIGCTFLQWQGALRQCSGKDKTLVGTGCSSQWHRGIDQPTNFQEHTNFLTQMNYARQYYIRLEAAFREFARQNKSSAESKTSETDAKIGSGVPIVNQPNTSLWLPVALIKIMSFDDGN